MKVPLNNMTYIKTDIVYIDDNIYVERYNLIEEESEIIIAASWIEKNHDGAIIKHHFTKPQFLIRHDRLNDILPSVIN
jgi:hypothetical protein